MHYQAHHLSHSIQGTPIFEGFNLDISDPQMLALTGPSGSGKTTLLNCLGLILKASSGKITIDGQEASTWSDKQRLAFWRNTAAFIYQDYGIIDEEKVSYNVSLKKTRGQDPQVLGALERVGIGHLAHMPAARLSGGEKQRLGIARAIYKKASLIFADEPTASLDAKNRHLVLDYLREQVQAGAIVLLSTHDEELASSCDSVLTLPGRN